MTPYVRMLWLMEDREKAKKRAICVLDHMYFTFHEKMSITQQCFWTENHESMYKTSQILLRELVGSEYTEQGKKIFVIFLIFFSWSNKVRAFFIFFLSFF